MRPARVRVTLSIGVLIDEFDKADPVFYSAFYQLFETGEFVDKNDTVKFGPSLVVCTSNNGSEGEIWIWNPEVVRECPSTSAVTALSTWHSLRV